MTEDNVLRYKQYMTPPSLSKLIVDNFLKETDIDILEPSCGSGSFLRFLPKNRKVNAVEIDTEFQEDLFALGKSYPGPAIEKKDKFFVKDNFSLHFENFLERDFGDQKFDLVIGNPPYGSYEKGSNALDVDFVKKCIGLLKEDGRIVFLLETKFLHGVKRYEEIWKDNAFLLSLNLLARRPRFSDFKGTATRDCSVFEMCKKRKYSTSLSEVKWLNLER